MIKRGDRYQIYDYNGNLVNQFTGVAKYVDEITVLADNTIVVYKSDEKKFYLYSPTGQLIKTSTERPLELGWVSSVRINGHYKSIVKYPDMVYQIIADQPIVKYYRDINQNLYQIETFTETVGDEEIISYKVHKYSRCSKKVSVLNMPRSQYEPMPPEMSDMPTCKPRPIIEYGEPLVAPNGDVYAWARTKTHYKILKWTWVDEPDTAADVPDAPEALKVTATERGLMLSWKASPQDPGCVTGYEIERSATSSTGYTKIADRGKGVLRYEDTTVEKGQVYYYRVRAMYKTAPSGYSNEANGRR
ncbi:MAG: fibronectin type III domain-containing protein [Thermodesulfovibrionales bacterium]|nr:fibronectin type III domain-containing protein [Thermodesulfovibrionales bacterium]